MWFFSTFASFFAISARFFSLFTCRWRFSEALNFDRAAAAFLLQRARIPFCNFSGKPCQKPVSPLVAPSFSLRFRPEISGARSRRQSPFERVCPIPQALSKSILPKPDKTSVIVEKPLSDGSLFARTPSDASISSADSSFWLHFPSTAER